jgi:hypothetical protein
VLCQLLRQFLRSHAGSRGDLIDDATKRRTHLFGCDGLIRSGGNPGAHRVAQPLLFQLRDDTLDTAVLLNERVQCGGYAGPDRAAQQAVK